MKTKQRTLKFIFAAALALAAVAPGFAAGLTVSISGMSCQMCSGKLEKAFQARPEVAAAKADVAKKTLAITWKDGKKMSDDDIKKLVASTGYKVTQLNAAGTATIEKSHDCHEKGKTCSNGGCAQCKAGKCKHCSEGKCDDCPDCKAGKHCAHGKGAGN